MKWSLHFLVSCLILTNAQAQTGMLQGRITNKQDGEPLPGANIFAQNKVGTISDGLGNFKISGLNPGNYRVTISFIGYEAFTQNVDIKADKNTKLDVPLSPGTLQLADVTVTAHNSNNTNNLTSISTIDIKLRPVNTSQDVLRMVPGLFVAQHAGGGKAEQIFLRGFDCDHGTDINLSVDGLPVNMVSHAHGQGYSDLHFIIPETIASVDFNKGPYYADKGNFTTAGYVAFKTENVLERNMFKFETGQFGLGRTVTMINLLCKKRATDNFKQNAYIAAEFVRSDGYFQNAQDFRRLNVLGKYTAWWKDKDMINVTLSTFDSKWNASGQIPSRAVESRLLPRFGSIDPTEGGNTQRINASVKQIHTFNNGGVLENQAFFTKYDFNLYSNFTFFLKDAVNGDQINQSESRKIFGYTGSYSQVNVVWHESQQLFWRKHQARRGGQPQTRTHSQTQIPGRLQIGRPV